MKRSARVLILVGVLFGSLLSAAPAKAAFHLMFVTEVFAGSASAPNAQFVELQMYSSSQNFVQSHAVRVYNAAGTEVGEFIFPTNVANGANQASILVGTTQVQAVFGVAPDLVMPNAVIPLAGGKVCFDGAPDCVAWGNYAAGPGSGANAVGVPAPAFCNSITRRTNVGGSASTYDFSDDTNDSANDFMPSLPAPRNNAGQTGSGGTTVCFDFHQDTFTAVEDAGGNTVVTGSVIAGVSDQARSVDLLVSAGTATAGSDYQVPSPNPMTLNFAAADNSELFSVTVLDDAEDEPTETINLTLQNPSSGTRIVDPNRTIEIIDNDGPSEISFAVPTMTVSEGDGDISVLASRGGNDDTFASAGFITAPGGTATPDTDYVGPADGTVEFAADVTSASIAVNIVDDDVDEPDETFIYGLTTSPNADIVAPTHVAITIQDNDLPPDETPPTSRITKPRNNQSYGRGSFTKLTGTAADSGGSGLALVQVAIRQTLKNNTCRWFTGSGFVKAKCSAKRWRNASGLLNWNLGLGAFRLPKSNTAKSPVKFYTAFSRARDVAGNVQSSFVTGRNANRFEIV